MIKKQTLKLTTIIHTESWHSEMAGAVGSAQGSAVTHPHWVQSKLLLSGFQQTCIKVTGLLQVLFLLSGKITCSVVLMIS